MRIFLEAVYQIAKRRVRRTANPQQTSRSQYTNWREKELERELAAFPPDIFAGKDLLDFGCGSGALSYLAIKRGAKSSVGIDLNPKELAVARSQHRGEPIRFVQAERSDRIDLPSESVDLIVCFDVMEHVMKYEAIIAEWKRVLRPGGRIIINWQPWFHPWAHHADAYLPVPWAHVFLTHAERSEVCARIVEMPEFDAPWWDYRDGKRVNRFREQIESGADEIFLNELTIAKFERIVERVGLRFEQRRYLRFSGPLPVRVFSALMTKIPGVREFFTATALYVISTGSIRPL